VLERLLLLLSSSSSSLLLSSSFLLYSCSKLITPTHILYENNLSGKKFVPYSSHSQPTRICSVGTSVVVVVVVVLVVVVVVVVVVVFVVLV
jgi:hypothetical protein